MAGDGLMMRQLQTDIGIAMGTGTDVAIESAKITLSKEICKVVKAKKTESCSHEKYQSKLVLPSFIMYSEYQLRQEFYILFRSLLSPMIAALAMSFSSVSNHCQCLTTEKN
jgi:Cu2+-exporting ATPase